MTLLSIIILSLSLLFLIQGLIIYHDIKNIKINIQQQKKKKIQLNEEIEQLNKEKNILSDNLIQLQTCYNKKQKQFNNDLQLLKKDKEEELNKNLQREKQLIKLNIEKANHEASQEIEIIHKDLNNIRESATKEKQEIQDELDKLKASLSAGVEARLREQQKKDKIKFYKLSINDADLSDVKMLENLKSSFHKPVVLSKLIWTQYFQKQMTELCDRVLGKKTVCGIYKITNLLTEQCYIGQSVNISDRWKQHCKCGLGIEASATNILYNSMQQDGVWNFSFELLEECPRNLLNQKEAFWIDTYSSNIYGLNTMKGIKT